MAKKDKQVKENNRYFKEMKTELKKVVWPTPKQLVNNTVAVIAFVLIFAIIVFVLDACLNSINKNGILKLQEKIQSSISSSNNTENETATDNSENDKSDENQNVSETIIEEQNNNQINEDNVQETPITSETEQN